LIVYTVLERLEPDSVGDSLNNMIQNVLSVFELYQNSANITDSGWVRNLLVDL